MRLLEAMGYRNVRHYAEGLEGWTEHGETLEAAPHAGQRVIVDIPRTSSRRRTLGRWLLDAVGATSFGALLLIWLSLVTGTALAYWLASFVTPVLRDGGVPVEPTLAGLGTALYFSVITATSVGFGDVAPLGAARALAAVESAGGLIMVGLLISKLVSKRQEQLVEEIHRTTFEIRLGRVRTSLHLVLADMQSIGMECTDEVPPARARSRIESAAMVLTGELRAVHDLLWRPQEVPDESVLQGILASTAAALSELADLVARHRDALRDSPGLDGDLRTSARLAREICGECVPHDHAPELKVCMDRIHDVAARLCVP